MIAVAQEAGMESDFVMAAMAEESSALLASSEDINQALLSSGLEADGSGFIPIVQSTIVASAASTSVYSLASVLATADPAAWSNPVDITIASTTVADPSQFNSLASVLAAAETATGANSGTVTSVNAGELNSLVGCITNRLRSYRNSYGSHLFRNEYGCCCPQTFIVPNGSLTH